MSKRRLQIYMGLVAIGIVTLLVVMILTLTPYIVIVKYADTGWMQKELRLSPFATALFTVEMVCILGLAWVFSGLALDQYFYVGDKKKPD